MKHVEFVVGSDQKVDWVFLSEDVIWTKIYSICTNLALSYSTPTHLSTLFVCGWTIMDLKLNNIAGLSFFNFYGNLEIFSPQLNVVYSYLRSYNAPDLQQTSGRSRMLRDAFRNSAVQSMFPSLYSGLLSSLHFIIEHYRTYFNSVRKENDPKLAVENI